MKNFAADHSITNHTEPDYGNDLTIDKPDTGNPGTIEFDNDKLDIEELDDEFNTQGDNDEPEGENFNNKSPDDTDEAQEINPDRPL